MTNSSRPLFLGCARHALSFAAGAILAMLSLTPGHADPAPTLLWQRFPGSVETDNGTAVAVDSEGGIIVGGTTSGSMGRRNAGGGDGFVVKYSPSGRLQWRRQPASARDDAVYGVAADVTDNVIAVGNTVGVETQGFVVKYAADGKILWQRRYKPADHVRLDAVATDRAGNIIAVGSTGDTVDALVIKYGPDGQEQWRRSLRSAGVDQAAGVATDAAGNIVVVGFAYGELGGTTGTFESDPFVAAYTADGTLRWIEQSGTRGDDVAIGVAIDDAGRIFVGGAQTPDPTKAVQGYLAAFSDDGAKQWQRQFGYTDYGVAIDSAGNVVITATAPGGEFALSYTAAGALQWTMKLPGTSVGWPLKPAADAAGHLFISGSIHRPGRGDYDGYVAKYALR